MLTKSSINLGSYKKSKKLRLLPSIKHFKDDRFRWERDWSGKLWRRAMRRLKPREMQCSLYYTSFFLLIPLLFSFNWFLRRDTKYWRVKRLLWCDFTRVECHCRCCTALNQHTLCLRTLSTYTHSNVQEVLIF